MLAIRWIQTVQCKSQWRFSLVGIDKPHKTAFLCSPRQLFQLTSPLLSSHLSARDVAVHISDWHDRQWKLFIPGSELVASCLSIHTNKGQRSHNEADKASLSSSRLLTHSLKRAHIHARRTFQKDCFFSDSLTFEAA